MYILLYKIILGGLFMTSKSKLFHKYYLEWIDVYKKGAVREVTLKKYYGTHQWVKKLAPKLKLGELNKRTYQQLINDFAETHEKQTTLDFHHQVKGAIFDAYDEGIIKRNPTRKIVIKGKEPSDKKQKYLSQFELQCLVRNLDLSVPLNLDWLILLIAKTGLRFSEALALTPEDFDFENQLISINKTWDYRNESGGFLPTKNASSIRTVHVEWKTMTKFVAMINELPNEQPIFITKRIHNSTVNNYLKRLCEEADIPVISIHGLRHTHASILLYAGVSIASVAKRLGHTNMTTTQKTYLHIIQELEDQDREKIINILNTI